MSASSGNGLLARVGLGHACGMLALSLLALLAQPPGASPGASQADDAAAAAPTYSDAVASLDAAVDGFGAEPATRAQLDALAEAIAEVDGFDAELVDDAAGREALVHARLALARELAREREGDPPDRAGARRLLDQLLRTEDPERVLRAVTERAPALEADAAAIHARLEAQGMARLEVVCEAACVVAVDHRPVEKAGPGVIVVAPVYLGRHDVTVLDAGTGAVAYTRPVVLTEPGTFESRAIGEHPRSHYRRSEDARPRFVIEAERRGREAEPGDVGDGEPGGERSSAAPSGESTSAPEAGPALDEAGLDEAAPYRRVLPRWVEITGLSVGAVLMVVGPVLWTMDDDCPDAGVALRDCPMVWETTPAGVITLSLGSVLAVTSAVMLAHDETRVAKSRERRVKLQANGVLRF